MGPSPASSAGPDERPQVDIAQSAAVRVLAWLAGRRQALLLHHAHERRGQLLVELHNLGQVAVQLLYQRVVAVQRLRRARLVVGVDLVDQRLVAVQDALHGAKVAHARLSSSPSMAIPALLSARGWATVPM